MLLANTPCPYARLEPLDAVAVDRCSDLPQAALAMRRTVTRDKEPTQWVAFINSSLHGSDLNALAGLLHAILRLACTSDSEVKRLYLGVDRIDWQLFVGPSACFVLTLSEVYGERDPRFLPGNTVIVVQPEVVFARRGITSGDRRDLVSDLVAKRFAAAGRPYETSAHATRVPKALRFLRDENNVPARWWETLLEPVLGEGLIPSDLQRRKPQATPAPKRAMEIAGHQVGAVQELAPHAFYDSSRRQGRCGSEAYFRGGSRDVNVWND